MPIDPLAGLNGPGVPTTPSEAPKSETKSSMPSPAEVASVDFKDITKGVGYKAPETKVEEALKPEPTKVETPKSNKKKYSLTVDGKNEDVELDLDNDEEIKKYLQKSRASDKRFQEAADVRKAAMDFIEQLRKNPRRVLSDPNIGVDIRKFAEEILNDEIKEMEKSPEQREKDKLIKELEEFKAKAKESEEARTKAERQQMEAEQERILESDISAALDIGGLPKTARTVKAMAELMMIALENNIDLSAKDIAPIVKNTNQREFKEMIDSLTDDQLDGFLGKEVINRLRKKNLAKAKPSSTSPLSAVKSTGQSPKQSAEPKKNEKISYRKFFGI